MKNRQTEYNKNNPSQPLSMRIIRNLLFLFLTLFSALIYAQKDVTIPETTSFNSSLGTESSINQSNGKLNIPLDLISLKGHKDLAASFGIGYDGSNVVKSAKASNQHSATGTLGLGWGTSFSRIFADNKLTAARDDDSFYIFEGGSLTKLIGTARSNSRFDFSSQLSKPWKIYYYPNQEKWEIVKENGYTYTYANIDYSVYWENWVGDSNQSGASRQGSSWNLTSVQDLHGNKVEYEYTNVQQSLKNTGSIKHTEATYLKKIIGPGGEEIRLIYGNKTTNEYYEPNTKSAEPDAYQENYEKKYLKRVEAYDENQNFLYKYRLDYINLGPSNEFRKRALSKITLINAQGESQDFREFGYDTNPSSDFYGTLLYQILPTKGKVSYHYAVNEIEIDQVFDLDILSENATLIVQKNYIIHIDWLRRLKVHTWNGTTWESEILASNLSMGGTGGNYRQIHLVARENFFGIVLDGSPGRIILAGRDLSGTTWNVVDNPHHNETGNFLEYRLMAGKDFIATGNPDKDRINFFRWDGYSWSGENFYNNSAGEYFYTATNNYLIQNKRQGGQDRIKFYYYDIAGDIQIKNFNAGFSTTGSAGYDNFWYGQNSFAQVNANANPEYLITWDKNYNYIGKTAPFGQIPDNSDVFGVGNNTFLTIDQSGGLTRAKHNRYVGNHNWQYLSKTISANSNADHYFGVKHDAFVYHASGSHNTRFQLFNANTGTWQESPYSLTSGGFEAYDFFGKNYAFAYSKIFKINQNLSLSQLSNSFPSNLIYAKSDGHNSLYMSSLVNGWNSDFARIISVTDKNELFQYTLPDDYFLNKNKFRNYPKYSNGYGTYIVKDRNSNSGKIYKLIDDKLSFNNEGHTYYKDVVVVKETYDPVLTRKQRTYFCYGDPKMSSDNMRVHYRYVTQTNDINTVIGKITTVYDVGEQDERRIGLPLEIHTYDANDELVSEQINTWGLRSSGNIFHINLEQKETNSFENEEQISIVENYDYDFLTGFLTKVVTNDSEGNTTTAETQYLHEHYPEATTYNLLAPVIYTRSYSKKGSNPVVYKSATAVKWDFTDIPQPQRSYAWKGTGSGASTLFNFSGSNSSFRSAQFLSKYDSHGNLLEERNRSGVVTSYVYGYGGMRLVAKVQGSTYAQAISLVNTTILNNPSNDVQMRLELQKIRDGLPNSFVTSYTYDPSIGVTSSTDSRSRSQYFVYDDFLRLDHIKDHEGNILKKNNYQYRSDPFVYAPESNTLPECESINIDPNGDDPVPITMHLTKPIDGNKNILIRAVASNGQNYNYQWTYGVFEGDINDFIIIEDPNGYELSIRNPNCEDAVFWVQATKTVGNNILVDTINHTFDPTPLDCTPL